MRLQVFFYVFISCIQPSDTTMTSDTPWATCMDPLHPASYEWVLYYTPVEHYAFDYDPEEVKAHEMTFGNYPPIAWT